MKSKKLSDNGGLRTWALVLSHGDEAAEALSTFARDNSISAAHITAIGAFSEAVLRFFDWETKRYEDIPVNEQCEVAAFIGDVAVDANGVPTVHAHMVLGKRGGTAVAGHLKRGVVRPTLEIIITEAPAHLRKVRDEESGLNLIDASL